MGYLIGGLEPFIRKVAYTTNDATSLVRWSNYTIHQATMIHFNDGSLFIRIQKFILLSSEFLERYSIMM
jgi:hypothetical protein